MSIRGVSSVTAHNIKQKGNQTVWYCIILITSKTEEVLQSYFSYNKAIYIVIYNVI